jgi:hypothetical protein
MIGVQAAPDYRQADPSVDAKQVGITGRSIRL